MIVLHSLFMVVSHHHHKALPFLHLRFGVALSSIRSQYYDRNLKRAVKFLRAAKKTNNSIDERAKINNLWIREANLKPVIAYLSAHRP